MQQTQNLSRFLSRTGSPVGPMAGGPMAGGPNAWLLLAQVADALKAAALAMLGEAGSPAGPIGPAGLPALAGPAALACPASGCTLAELINEFLKAKARADKSLRYLATMRFCLAGFSRGRRSAEASSVTPADIERWLSGHGWAARTQKGYLLNLRTLYNFGVRRGLVPANPAAEVEVPEPVEKEIVLHTPAQVAAVLAYARRVNLDICRALAIRYFAGLRSAEVDRLEESEIRPQIGVIEVRASKAKTRRRRAVTIEPNLAAWLALGGQLPLSDLSNTWRFFTAGLKSATGIDWPRNVTRHSFCSYHLAQFHNAARTALEAGHSEQILFTRYRSVVAPAAAAAYWAIVPAPSA